MQPVVRFWQTIPAELRGFCVAIFLVAWLASPEVALGASRHAKGRSKSATKTKTTPAKTKATAHRKPAAAKEPKAPVVPAVERSAPFEGRLHRVHALWAGGRFAELAAELNALPRSTLLEDLRLYLLAEAQRQAGQETAALATFRRLFQEFPGSWMARTGAFPYLLLAARLEGVAAEPRLAPLVADLPTPYQRGRALEALAALYPAGSPERGRRLLEALRAYRSKSHFYQDMPESQGCLKSLLDEAPAFPFTRQEWLEILLRACREGLGVQAERAAAIIASRFSRDGPAMVLLVQAEAARVRKQGPAVLAAIDQLLAQPTVDPGLVALGRQIKGEYFHFNGQHVPALAELKLALAHGRAPVDVVAAQYRLMRSAAEAGYEAEAVKAAQWLGREASNLPVLPVHLFEMGLQRYDAGRLAEAVPYFLTLARACPGHHRADDALGYAARAVGLDSRDGRDLLALLRRVYPHSFFVYWLDPAARTAPMPQVAARPPALPASLKKRIPAWRVLLKSPFSKFARDEIFGRLDEAPGDPALTWAASEAAIDAHDYFLVTAFGERFLKALLDEGKTGAQVPSWVWQIYYPRPYWDKVQMEARKYGLDPWWVLSIMREESHFNPNILSRSNAHGLMQILPSTGKWIADKLGLKEKFDKNSLWNIDRNIAFGTWYLGYLRDLFNGDLFLAAAAYNGGQGNILRKVEQGPYAHLPVLERLDRVPLPETRDYYKKVMGSWWNYRRLYEN